MYIDKIILPERVVCQHKAKSKKAVLQAISALLETAAPSLKATDLFDAYIERERLGSTALGDGIAIPHIRNNEISLPVGCFLQLEKGIDFGAPDKQPVDLIFALLAPVDDSQQHLNILAELAGLLSCPDIRHQLRHMRSVNALYRNILNLSHVETA